MVYLPWVTPGYFYYGSGSTQQKINAEYVSWGLREYLGPKRIEFQDSRFLLTLTRKLSF